MRSQRTSELVQTLSPQKKKLTCCFLFFFKKEEILPTTGGKKVRRVGEDVARCALQTALTTNPGQRLVTSPETEFKVVRALQQPLFNRETPFTTQDPATAAHRWEEGEEGVVSCRRDNIWPRRHPSWAAAVKNNTWKKMNVCTAFLSQNHLTWGWEIQAEVSSLRTAACQWRTTAQGAWCTAVSLHLGHYLGFCKIRNHFIFY